MGADDGARVLGKGLILDEFLALFSGDTLLLKRGYGRTLFAAEVTVLEVLHDEEKCKVKVMKIVSRGTEARFAVGEVIVASREELTKV